MLLFSPQWLFVAPGLILFLCSAIAYGFLVLGPVHLGGINFQEHTLFYAQTGIVLGFLAVALGIIMRMFGIREGLLRENSTLERLRTSPILEIGGLTGVIIILLGLYFLHRNCLCCNFTVSLFIQLFGDQLMRTFLQLLV